MRMHRGTPDLQLCCLAFWNRDCRFFCRVPGDCARLRAVTREFAMAIGFLMVRIGCIGIACTQPRSINQKRANSTLSLKANADFMRLCAILAGFHSNSTVCSCVLLMLMSSTMPHAPIAIEFERSMRIQTTQHQNCRSFVR
jgi:hypothetical protein